MSVTLCHVSFSHRVDCIFRLHIRRRRCCDSPLCHHKLLDRIDCVVCRRAYLWLATDIALPDLSFIGGAVGCGPRASPTALRLEPCQVLLPVALFAKLLLVDGTHSLTLKLEPLHVLFNYL